MSYSRMKTNHYISEKDWELIAKSIYDKNADDESADQNVDKETLPVDDAELKQVARIAKQVDSYFEQKRFDSEKAWHKVDARISARQMKIRPIYLNPLFRIAASIIFAALLLFSGYEVLKAPSSLAMKEINSGNELLNPIALPDGTLVSLNSDSKISYPNEFSGKTREVTLEGEAFFQVKPNKDMPFIIKAGNAQVKVLGTSFNVNAYPMAKQVEVIVETGRVQFVNQSPEFPNASELILNPGDKGTLDCSDHSMLKTSNEDPNFIAWKTRNFIFTATPLSEVVDKLEKVYKVEINIANPELNGLLLTSRFNNYTIDFILGEIIKTTFGIEVENVNGKYILKAKV